MDSDKSYEVVDVPGRGKMVLAAKDLLPGTHVIIESPVMFISKEYAAQYGEGNALTMIMAGYSIYNKMLSPENKRRFDALYGPVTGPHAEKNRTFARTFLHTLVKDGVTPQECETFVRVASTISFNAFGVHAGGSVVMDDITRMSHSCLPNCVVDTSATRSICTTVLPIKKGEELTVEYGLHRLKPTHFRRHRYLEMKDFTCHCPRCDAEGDDTREFDCFDPECPGSCFACQPLNKEPFEHDLHYTGVEYVEPHLLPCTVCHRASPLKYQQDMFALEKRLPEITADLERQFAVANDQFEACAALQKKMIDLKYPRKHSLSLGILKIRYQLNLNGVYTRGKAYVSEYIRTFQEYLDQHERLIRRPDGTVAGLCCDALQTRRCLPEGTLPLGVHKDWGQKGLRMLLIAEGREVRETLYDELLTEVLQRLPPQPATTTECMFCGESPLRAAFTLKRCGRCKQVTYCSGGCQKAHWPLHKKCCKTA